MKTEAMLTVLLILATFIILLSSNCLAILAWLDPYSSIAQTQTTNLQLLLATRTYLGLFPNHGMQVLKEKTRPLPYNFMVLGLIAQLSLPRALLCPSTLIRPEPCLGTMTNYLLLSFHSLCQMWFDKFQPTSVACVLVACQLVRPVLIVG